MGIWIYIFIPLQYAPKNCDISKSKKVELDCSLINVDQCRLVVERYLSLVSHTGNGRPGARQRRHC